MTSTSRIRARVVVCAVIAVTLIALEWPPTWLSGRIMAAASALDHTHGGRVVAPPVAALSTTNGIGTSAGTTAPSRSTVSSPDPIGADGFSLVAQVTDGARMVREFDWGTLRTLVYQGGRFAEVKLEVGYSGPPYASPSCTITGRSVQVDPGGLRFNTVGTMAAPATEPVGLSWTDPPEFTSGYNLGTAKFSVDIKAAPLYAAMTIVVPVAATVSGVCRLADGTLEPFVANPSSTMTVRIVIYKDVTAELLPYESDQILQVHVKQLMLTPSDQVTNPRREGVYVQTKPVVGESVSIASKSGTFTFSPEKAVTENYQDALGLVLFNYSAKPSFFGSQASINDDVDVTIGGESGWGRKLWLNFAEVESVLNDVTAQPPLSVGYAPIQRGDKLAPGTIVQLRNTLDQQGRIKPPVLSLRFYSGRRAEVELPHTYTYDPDQGPLYLKLGESGVTQQATADFVTDGTNLARSVSADPREYARVLVYEAVSKGLVNAVGGGFGFIAKSTAGKVTKWGLEKFDDWYSSTPPDPLRRRTALDSAILPSGGGQDGGYIVGTFMSDGSLVLSNSGVPMRVRNVPEGTNSPLFTSSELSVGGSTGALSASSPLLIRGSSAMVPIHITPANGSTVPSLWPCISLEYPNDAVPGQPRVDLSSLSLRVNGYLASAQMFPGAYATGFRGTILKSMWCAPADRPFLVGANTITAGITTFGSQRAKTSVTITAQASAPRAPTGLLAYPGASRILLSWDRNGEPDIAQYRVYRGDTLVGQSGESKLLVSAAQSLAGDYSVAAVSALGLESARSAKAYATPVVSGTFPPPGKPVALQTTAGDSRVDLRVMPLDTTSLAWRIERSSGESGPFAVRCGLCGATYSDESVTNGAAYWYKAVPIGYDGAEGDSLSVGPVTPLNAAPLPPKGVTVEVSENAALIEWNPSAERDLAGYRVYRKEFQTANWVQQTGVLLHTTSFSNAVGHEKLYAWKVTAVDSGGLESPGSAPVTGGSFGTLDSGPPVGPAISAGPATLRFAGTNTNGTLSPMTNPQLVTVTFSTPSSIPWTATTSDRWVQITGGSGTGSGTFTVGIINPGNVLGTIPLIPIGPAGLASATIMVTAGGASNSPQMVAVDLTLRQAAANVAPFGLVDTPLQNAAGVVGTIGVTGWVVDDVGVTGVKIYRNCLAFEPTSNCVTVNGAPVVFVGDATLVSGARPDVEALYPMYPQAYRAAWGYLLLTNLLPHVPNQQMFGGQGTMTFSVLATDVEGKQTWLGRTLNDTTATTIALANDTIAKPFGAIDTPGQGATVSGTFANFGWALTPDANTSGGEAGDIVVPTDGSTLRVYLDGVPGATIAYNQCRGTTAAGPVPAGVWCNDDVASIFGHPTPQATFAARAANATKHRNLDVGRGAIGALLIDTTTLANGVHTIMWGVTDSAGRGEGLGSRYFTVLNAGPFDSPAPGTALAQGRPSDSPAPPLAQGKAPEGRVLPWPEPVEGRPGGYGGSKDPPYRNARENGGTEVPPYGNAAALPVSLDDIWARTGLDLDAPFAVVPADDAGIRAVRIPELGRLEVHVGSVDAGHLVANGEVRDLPPGAHLDRKTGIFTWAPGVGYLGTYRLVFVRVGEQIPLDVTIAPVRAAAPGEAEIRIQVDTPTDGAGVSGRFAVAGWALDPQAALGSGIDAVHVWAQRVDGAGTDPVFLGAAAVGGARPDVATAWGRSFGTAGFSLTSDQLPPGRYDITAYVRNRRTARWEDARTVRVTVR